MDQPIAKEPRDDILVAVEVHIAHIHRQPTACQYLVKRRGRKLHSALVAQVHEGFFGRTNVIGEKADRSYIEIPISVEVSGLRLVGPIERKEIGFCEAIAAVV